MPAHHDRDTLKRYVIEAAHVMGMPLQPAWVDPITQHLSLLLEAADIVEASSVTLAEPVTTFEP